MVGEKNNYYNYYSYIMRVVPCSPGKYKEGVEVDKCDECPNGQYQPNFASESCLLCPRFGTTVPGASLVQDCLGAQHISSFRRCTFVLQGGPEQ